MVETWRRHANVQTHPAHRKEDEKDQAEREMPVRERKEIQEVLQEVIE